MRLHDNRHYKIIAIAAYDNQQQRFMKISLDRMRIYITVLSRQIYGAVTRQAVPLVHGAFQ